jgi:putative tryptophan/tyrosine transport system substrate-binding protein
MRQTGRCPYRIPRRATNTPGSSRLAQKTRLPAIYPARSFVEDGGLMSHGMNLSALGQRVADIVDQILKGQKPSDIPVFQPIKFEPAINLKMVT